MRHLSVVLLLSLSAVAFSQQMPRSPVLALQQNITASQEAASATPSPAFARNLPIARLALKKARLLGSGAFTGVPDNLLDQILAQGRAALQRAKAGEMPTLAPGKLNELAYITANDQTVQPYYLYAPPDYTPDKKWPLIVFLHGYVPSISVLDPWIPSDDQCAIAGKYGCLLLIPYGRRNTDFQGIGEQDVLASTAEVCKWYPVDPDRIYLSGVSMGGMGAWNLALRHPGMYAAVTPMCGQTDMFRWWHWDRDQTEPWKRWLIEWDNALDQVPNVRNQHIFVQHGLQDNLIPVEQTKLMVVAAEQAGTPIKTYYFPDEGHYIYFRTDSFDNAWSWLGQFKAERSPRRVDLKCYSLEYSRAYWLTIDALQQWGTPGQVTAELSDDRQTLTVTSTNIAALTFDLSQLGLKAGDKARVLWNGQEQGTLTGNQPSQSLSLAPPSPPGQLTKRHGLCGPCEEVMDTRFLVVQGTQGTDDQKAELARQVAQWSKDWDDFGDGCPPVKLDSEITPQDIESANLVLFGTPQTNSVLAKLADNLPIKIGDHRYEVGEKVYEGNDLGLVMCYPNPLNPQHYVLVYAGEPWGQKLSVNHKHDLLPDFEVFTTKSFGRDDTNDALCAGFFGMNWQLNASTTWTPRRSEP